MLSIFFLCAKAGGYKKGSRAQEEDLFRRTTLSSALDRDFGASVTYPLEEFSPILTRDVYVFRGPEHEGSNRRASCVETVS